MKIRITYTVKFAGVDVRKEDEDSTKIHRHRGSLDELKEYQNVVSIWEDDAGFAAGASMYSYGI